MTNSIINYIDKKVVTLDEAAKTEIESIIEALTECDPLDIAIDISEIDIFDGLDRDTISVMIEEKIIELKADKIAKIKAA